MPWIVFSLTMLALSLVVPRMQYMRSIAPQDDIDAELQVRRRRERHPEITDC